MKKTVLTITTIVVASLGFAQKAKVVSAYNYNKAFERSLKCSELVDGLAAINEAINDAEAQTWAKTWYYRGNLYFNVLASKTSKESCVSLDADALEKCTDSYMKAMVLNFHDPELKKLDLEKEEDVMKFFMALQNQSKVDDEMYTMDIIGRKIPGLAGEYSIKGGNQFDDKNYKGAQESFGKSMMLSQLSGKMDTSMMFNIALAAYAGEDFEIAKQMYDALIMLKYVGTKRKKGAICQDGTTSSSTENGACSSHGGVKNWTFDNGDGPILYLRMANIYKSEGDTNKAKEYIKKGRVAYPDEYSLIAYETDIYLAEKNYKEALNGINQAISSDPSNHLLYFNRGVIYENLNREDDAVQDYKKAIELKSDDYNSYFNLGAYYYNKGAEKINEANALPYSETKKFEAMKLEAKKLFELGMPSLEKANELNPKDVDTANMLIKVYTQTEQYDKAKAIKAKYQ